MTSNEPPSDLPEPFSGHPVPDPSADDDAKYNDDGGGDAADITDDDPKPGDLPNRRGRVTATAGERVIHPYYVIVAGLPGVLEVLDIDAHTVNAKLRAMASAQLLHTFDLPNDVVLTISLQHVHHWTVTPERPKDILIVPSPCPNAAISAAIRPIARLSPQPRRAT